MGHPNDLSFLKDRIKIVDTTLKDGEEAYGIVFSTREKLTIASYLDQLGVSQIIAGFPAEEGEEREYIKKLIKLKKMGKIRADLLGWHRPVIWEIKSSTDLGLDGCCITTVTSDYLIEKHLHKDPQWVIEVMTRAAKFIKRHHLYLCVNAEDASRADFSFLMEFCSNMKELGVDRFAYCDNLGYLSPFTVYEKVKALLEVGIDIEVNAYNDLGLSVANVLAAVKALAEFPERKVYLTTSINGLGAKAGHAPLEEVILALKFAFNIDLCFETELLKETCDYVAAVTNQVIPRRKPIIGDFVFSYTSKERRDYELFNPMIVGGKEGRFGINKHSNTATLISKYDSLGLGIIPQEASLLLQKVREEISKLKRMPTNRELMDIYYDFCED